MTEISLEASTGSDHDYSEESNNLPLEASTWRILVDPIGVATKSEGGLEFTKSQIEAQEYLRYVGQVISMGPLVFRDDRFKLPDGSYHRPCEVGDWVLFGQHTGKDVFLRQDAYKIRQLRLINDDQVMAKVTDIKQVKIPLL